MLLKRVSCVLRLCDSVQNRGILSSQAILRIDGIPAKPVYKPGGYFVLIDLPEGLHHVEVMSALFQPDAWDVTVDYTRRFDEKLDVQTVMLNPNRSHPAARTNRTLCGTFSRGSTVFYLEKKGTPLKIAQDGAEAGCQRIKLFAESTILLPSLFQIRDKDEHACEFVMLTAVDGDLYTLSAPLRFAHKRSTALIPMVRYQSAKDGSFFAILPKETAGHPSSAVRILLETENKLCSYEISPEQEKEKLLITL